MPAGQCEVNVENNNGAYIMHAVGKNDAYQKEVMLDFVLDSDKLRVIDWKEQ
jgi:hypothetical protein